MQYNEAEQAFYSDIREKKKAASGVHSKTGSRGYVGKMLFPSDIMSRKEKYNHRKAGKVQVSNLYEEVLTVDEFEQLEIEDQKNRMQYWRSNYSNKEIQKKMGIANTPFYKIVKKLDLPKAPRTNGPQMKKPRKATATAKKTLLDYAAIESQQSQLEFAPEAPPAPPEAIPAPVQELLFEGLHIVYNGTYTAESIQKKLSKIDLLIDGEPEEFYIEFKLVQKQTN
jgi:hypothetical protein